MCRRALGSIDSLRRPARPRRRPFVRLRNGITMATDAPVQIPRQRIAELVEREEKELNDRTQRSKEMYARAQVHLAGGVASSYQLRDPWPIYLERGTGPRVWDVDGNEMYDFHNGFGSMVQGHAHPAIQKAIVDRYASGTHFAAPTEDAIVVGDELARRWAFPRGGSPNPARRPPRTPSRFRAAPPAPRPTGKIFGPTTALPEGGWA